MAIGHEQDACDDDLGTFWEILAKGCCRGINLADMLAQARDSLNEGIVRQAVEAVALQVSEGTALSTAMATQPDVFSRAHVALVEGGERIGMMDKSFLLILEATWRCPTCSNLHPRSKASAV